MAKRSWIPIQLRLPTTALSAAEIQQCLVVWARTGQTLAMANVRLLGGPWILDVIHITAAFYCHEYEVKMTVDDYRADFRKKTNGFVRSSPRKHDVYMSSSPTMFYGYPIPIPKSFSFVTPPGLLTGIDVPDHCGILECDGERVRVVRAPPTIPGRTKLSPTQIFNLACKVAKRIPPNGG